MCSAATSYHLVFGQWIKARRRRRRGRRRKRGLSPLSAIHPFLLPSRHEELGSPFFSLPFLLLPWEKKKIDLAVICEPNFSPFSSLFLSLYCSLQSVSSLFSPIFLFLLNCRHCRYSLFLLFLLFCFRQKKKETVNFVSWETWAWIHICMHAWLAPSLLFKWNGEHIILICRNGNSIICQQKVAVEDRLPEETHSKPLNIAEMISVKLFKQCFILSAK